MEVVKRCCATCEWSISPQEEDDILIDNPESETRAGDCCLNIDHKRKFFCDSYSYRDNIVENVIDDIIHTNRHQFIFAYDGDAKDEFVAELESRKNSIISIEELKLDTPRKKVKDVIKLKATTREYLYFKIALDLLKKIKKFLNIKQQKELIQVINRLFLNKDYENIENYETLLSILKESVEFYKKNYIKLINEEDTESIDKLKIQFMDILKLIEHVKKITNGKSYISLIFNNKDYPILLEQAIMNFVTSRCNSDLSVKIVTEFDKWKTNYDQMGNLAQCTHDYDIIELDDNYQKQLKKC